MILKLLISLYKYSEKTYSSCKKNAERITSYSFFNRVDFIHPDEDLDRKFIYARKLYSINFKSKTQYSDLSRFNSNQPLHIHSEEKGLSVWKNIIEEDQSESEIISISYSDLNIKLPFNYKLKKQFFLALSLFVYLKHFSFSEKKNRNCLRLPATINILVQLLYLIKKHKPSKVYFSGAYLAEGNLITSLLIRNNINTCVYTSGTPLKKHLSHIFTNDLCLSNAYQKEEAVQEFSESILVTGKIRVTKPYTHKTLLLNLNNAVGNINNIGIYTYGGWKRSALKIHVDLESKEREEKIFSLSQRLSTLNKRAQFTVYPHPIEKKSIEYPDSSKEEHLKQIINKELYSFVDPKKSTVSEFDKCEIALTGLSNTLFERLYSGYKVIIIILENDWFPHQGSSLEHITVKTGEELVSLFNTCSNLSPKDYFIRFELGDFLAQEVKDQWLLLESDKG